MTITQQLKAIKKVATKNLHKSPTYFRQLVDEIDLKLFELESEKQGLIEQLEIGYDSFEPFSFKEVG